MVNLLYYVGITSGNSMKLYKTISVFAIFCRYFEDYIFCDIKENMCI